MIAIDRFSSHVDKHVEVTDSQLEETLCENHNTQLYRRELRERKQNLSEAFEHITCF